MQIRQTKPALRDVEDNSVTEDAQSGVWRSIRWVILSIIHSGILHGLCSALHDTGLGLFPSGRWPEPVDASQTGPRVVQSSDEGTMLRPKGYE